MHTFDFLITRMENEIVTSGLKMFVKMCYTIFKTIEVNIFQKDFLKHNLQNGVQYYGIVLTKYMPKAFVFAKLSIV